MPGGTQERDEHGPDVATVTGDEDPHTYLHRRWVSRGGTVPLYSMICDGLALIRQASWQIKPATGGNAKSGRKELLLPAYLGITGTGSKVTYVRANPRGTMR